MQNREKFKKWLINKGFENYEDVIGVLNNANSIYNDSTDKKIDFMEDSQTFLAIAQKNDIAEKIKDSLLNIIEGSNNKLQPITGYYFDTLNSIAIYSMYLSDYGNKHSKDIDTIEKFVINTNLTGGKNKIYYGAPGTGKSFKVDCEYPNFKRVTFHPEYTYFDFVGGLRPTQDEVTEQIKYEFVPGPFTDALLEAIFDNENYHGLIIEELNRANTAAVFGDIFQLLDRDDNGNSKYSVINKEITDYIMKTKGVYIDELILPSNFSIIATMNSADQGVNVLDSAFKRRWQFEYIPINFKDPNLPRIKIAGFKVPWNEFGEKLNNFMSLKGIDEDKLIGQRFITENEMKDQQLIASKLLIYLWDDVFRYNRKTIFKEHHVFSKLIEDYHQNGIKCFVPTLEKELYKSLNIKDQYRIDEGNSNEETSIIDEELNDD